MKSTTLLIIFTVAICEGQNIFKHCDLSPNVKRITPKLLIGTSAHDYDHDNVSYTFSSSYSAQVTLECFANFPLEWIFYNDVDAVGQVTKTRLRHTRKFLNFHNVSTYKYTSLLTLFYTSRIIKPQIFSCQATSSPCHRRFVTSRPVDHNRKVKVTWEKDLNINGIEEKDTSHVSNKNETCEAIFYYQLRHNWTFCCESPQKKEIGLPLLYPAPDFNTLQNIQRNSSEQSKKCAIEIEKPKEFCRGRQTSMLKDLISGQGYGIVCILESGHNLEPLIRIMPSFSGSLKKLYFNWNEINGQDMLTFEWSNNQLIVYEDQHVNLTCHASLLYFAYGAIMTTVDHLNNILQIFQQDDKIYPHNRVNNSYKIHNTIQMNKSITKIYCLAPIWNSTDWVNKSISVKILKRQPIKIENSDKNETVTWNVGDRDRSLTCKVKGLPLSKIEWFSNNRIIQTQTQNDNSTFIVSTLNFPKVELSHTNSYICIVSNDLDKQDKFFQLNVKDKTSTIVISMIFTVGIICGLLVVVFYWRKSISQKKARRLLTKEEIEEFKNGKVNESTTDPQLLPFNSAKEIDRHRLHINETNLLGQGAYGLVYKGQVNIAESGFSGIFLDVAVKTVPRNGDVLYFKAFLSELKTMAYIGSHDNVINLIASCTQNIAGREVYMALEFCQNGNLRDYLLKHRHHWRSSYVNIDHTIINDVTLAKNIDEQNLDSKQLLTWSKEIAAGMNFISSKNIVHGDLALRNILLTKRNVAKVGDFGLARILVDCSVYVKKNSEQPLPWKWLSPETLENLSFSLQSDIWSYGILLWELFSLGSVPYGGARWTTQFVNDLKNGMRLGQPPNAPNFVYSVMTYCWKNEPSDRPPFQQLEHLFSQTQNKKIFLSTELSQDYDNIMNMDEPEIITATPQPPQNNNNK